MMKFKTGDKVIVISGKDKGRGGTIEKIYPKKELVVIPGVNIYKKHVKKQAAADGKGGIYELPRPLPWSKVAHVDPKDNKATRVGFDIKKDKQVQQRNQTKNEYIKKKMPGRNHANDDERIRNQKH